MWDNFVAIYNQLSTTNMLYGEQMGTLKNEFRCKTA